MANRVDSVQVRAILKTTTLDYDDIDVHIGVANNLIADLLGSSGLSATTLTNIELYLAAHFAAISDPDAGMLIEKEIGDLKSTYPNNLGEALKMTRFGQQALVLDTTNTLTSAGKTRARFRAFGHLNRNETDTA